MPTSSGFSAAPVTKSLIAYTVVASLIASATDTKYYFNVLIVPHLFGKSYSGQWWRLLAWPLCYANSTELLFATMTLYQLRVLERIWGSRKFATFLLTTAPYTILLPPALLLLLRPLTGGTLNHLPAGPTSILFAILAQYHAAIPYTFRYRLSASTSDEDDAKAITLTSKSTSYLLPLQLAFSQLPGSLIPAIVGWIVGYAWRAELLPVLPRRSWRVPGWMVGEKDSSSRHLRSGENSGVEGLRRRMQEEGRGAASGVEDVGSSSGRRR